MLDRLWASVVLVVALVGVGLSWVADSGSTLGLVFAATIGATVLRCALMPDEPGRALRGAVPVAFAFGGWYGLAGEDAGLGMGLALLALLTWPRGVSAVARYVRDGRPISRLSDDELSVAWRRSHASLEAAPVGRRLGVVQLRAAYLDEISRRHPDRSPDEQFTDPA